MSRLRVRCVLVSVFCATVTSAHAEGDKEAAKQIKALQGTWIIQSVERNGETVSRDKLPVRIRNMTRIVKGDAMTVMSLGREMVCGMTIKTNVKPHAIDLTIKREGRDPLKVMGIFEVKGDTLQIAEDTRRRPKSFKSNRGDRTIVYTFNRKKEADK